MTNELLNICCMDVDSKTYWRNTNVNIDVLRMANSIEYNGHIYTIKRIIMTPDDASHTKALKYTSDTDAVCLVKCIGTMEDYISIVNQEIAREEFMRSQPIPI